MRLFRSWRVRWGWSGPATDAHGGAVAAEPHDTMATGGPAASRAISLSQSLTGQELIVAEINDHRRLQHRLAELGLRPGVRIKVVSRGCPGPFIVAVHDSRLVLGQGMAEKVMAYPT